MKRFFDRVPARGVIIGVAITLVLLSSIALAQQVGSYSPGGALSFFVRGLMTRYMPVDSYGTTADINTRGDLMIAQALPERAELVRLGNSWTVVDTTAVAAVIATPTTTAQNTFWNGEPDGGKSYVVDRAFCTITTSAGAATAHSIMGVLNKGPVAAPTAVSLTVSTLNGRNYGGKVVVARSAAVTDDKWWALPGVANSITTAAGTTDLNATIESQLNGLIVIPPRHQFSLALMAVNTTAASRCGITWHEVQIPVVY